MTDQASLEEAELENLKVVDLKKKLKDLRLPVNGNKSELIDRLQEHFQKGSMASSGDGILSPSDSLSDSATNMEDFSFSSPEKETENTPTFSSESSFTCASVPLKKRAVVQASSGVAKVETKKIIINRVSVPTPKFVPVEKNTDDTSSITALKEQVDNSGKVESTKPKDVIQLSTKNLSQAERLNLRKAKFVADQGSVEQSKKITFGSENPKAPKKLITAIPTGSNLELLKKRAERFGENVSGVMKKMEDQQRVLNRKTKFGMLGNGVSNPDEQEKKRKRAERFGL